MRKSSAFKYDVSTSAPQKMYPDCDTMEEIVCVVALLRVRLLPFGVQRIKLGPIKSLSNRWLVIELSGGHSPMHYGKPSLREYDSSRNCSDVSRKHPISLREALASNKLREFVYQEQIHGAELTRGSDFERALVLLSQQWWRKTFKDRERD